MKCCDGVMDCTGTFSPTSTTGSACSSSSALESPSSRASRYSARKPWNLMMLPVERNRYERRPMLGCSFARMSKSTVVVSNTAGAICDAMKRCQMS